MRQVIKHRDIRLLKMIRRTDPVIPDDGEPHRWEYKADGIYVYYSLVDGQWVDNVNSFADYFIDGTLLCMRWKNVGNDTEYREWWEVESIQDGVMKWTALRQREDGSTYTTTFQMTKVE